MNKDMQKKIDQLIEVCGVINDTLADLQMMFEAVLTENPGMKERWEAASFKKQMRVLEQKELLEVFDFMEALRLQEEKGIKKEPLDLAIRKCQAFLAQKAGIQERSEWLHLLAADQESSYARYRKEKTVQFGQTLAAESPGDMEVPGILNTLDWLEMIRIRKKNEPTAMFDHTIRLCEASLAENAGYHDRNEWTEALKSDPDSVYAAYIKEGTVAIAEFEPEEAALYESGEEQLRTGCDRTEEQKKAKEDKKQKHYR